MTVLKETFIRLLSKHTSDERLKNELWTEIEKNYTGESRHYHTLLHLDSNYLKKETVNLQNFAK